MKYTTDLPVEVTIREILGLLAWIGIETGNPLPSTPGFRA